MTSLVCAGRCFSVSAISSLLLGFARSKVLVYVTLFGILPIGNCMGMPMLTIGIKRYTTPANRGFAFGLYYAAMNVAALASGPMVDFFNIVIRPSSGSQSFSGNRMVILSNTFVYLLSLLVTFCWLREIRVGDQDHEQDLEQQQVQGHSTATTNPLQGQYSTVSAAAMVEVEQGYELTALRRDSDGDNPLHYRGGPASSGTSSPNNRAPTSTMTPASNARASFSSYEILADLSTSPTFWRFVVFTLFLINLRTIFRHVDATLPTYLIRCFGPTYPKGMIYSINPFLIILLTPPLSALTAHWAHFDMIKYGGYASALSPLFVACSTSTWAVVLFMVMLSLGEAFWSPRLYDYTMSIAPEGKEASFSALASAPIFAAQVPVGLLSGYLVSTYLPQDGSRRDGKTLWLIICLLTLTSPVLITVCERWIREPSPSKRDDEADKVHAATDIDYADSDDEENTVTL